MRDPREATDTSADDTARVRLAAIAVPATLFAVLTGVTWAAAPGTETDRLLLILVNGLILAAFATLGIWVAARPG